MDGAHALQRIEGKSPWRACRGAKVKMLGLTLERAAFFRDARRNLKQHAQGQADIDRDQIVADAMQRVAD